MPEGKIALVLRGFTSLSSTEQRQFVKQLNEYISAQESQRRALKEGFEKRASLSLGPLDPGGCPCCGR